MVVTILSEKERSKADNNNDTLFYSVPRFVNHLDMSFRNRLCKLYQDCIPESSVVLDLMSSWVSHLPKHKQYRKVIGHGLNKQELEANARLDEFWIQDLNINQILPIEDSSIDIVLIVAGWQYLQQPEIVAEELRRIIKTQGLLIISFSNRAFWPKTPYIWNQSSPDQQLEYISRVLVAQGWSYPDFIVEQTFLNTYARLLGIKGDPFYSVISRK